MFESLKQQKPTGEFFEKLGHYVYAYICRETGEWLYVGKGLGARVYDHVNEKEYDWEDSVLLDRNCEQWGDGNKIAILKEGTYIKQYNPRDNKVSGHHKEEYYIMSRFSGLFEQHQNDQRKMHSEMNAIIDDNPVIEQYFGWGECRGKTFQVETKAFNDLYCGIKCDASGSQDVISVKFKASKAKKVFLEQIKEMCEDLSQNGQGSGNDPWVSYEVEDLDAAVALWTDFVSS